MSERQQIEFSGSAIFNDQEIVYQGWNREVKGVPLTGPVAFSDIGNLAILEHEGAKNVDLSDQKLLNIINAYDQTEDFDPDQWRGAVWGNGKKVRAGDATQKPPAPDEMDFAVANDFGGDHSGRWDEDNQAYFLQCQTRSDEQVNWNKNCAAYLVNYIGRFEAGTKLTMSFEHRARNQERYGDGSYIWLRGWPDGYYTGAGIYHDYVQKYYGPRDYGFKYFEQTITVLSGYKDIWVAFEVQDNQPRYHGDSYNRAYIRNWKIRLAA